MTHRIGTRFESSLHRDLKENYTGQGGQTEAEVGRFVADGINADGEYIEIQTGSFAPLRKKALELALRGRLRIIYPVIISKYIEVFDAEGKLCYRRKSPRRGNPWDLFYALVYAPELPLISGIAIELVIIDALEQRIQDGKGSWRRRGLSIQDRRLLQVHECICLKNPPDYLRFVPFSYNEQFTSEMLREKTGIPIVLARKTLYVLSKMGLVERVGKQGKAQVYQLIPLQKP